MTRALPVLVFLLAACPSRPGGQKTFTGLHHMSPESRHYVQQPCDSDPKLKLLVDRMMVIVIEEFVADGVVTYDKLLERHQQWPAFFCLIEKPQECCEAGSCAGPCKWFDNGLRRCQRKAGCANERMVWASYRWPPVCLPEWPDEPGCAAQDRGRYDGWKLTLAHELVNRAALLAWIYDPDYKSEIFADGGIDSRVMTRVRRLSDTE